MKTNRIFIMALACIAAVSCVKENAPEQTSGLVSFVAEKETFGDQTKAVLVDGKKTEWQAGDEVAVFDGTASHKFIAAADGARVEFTTTSTTVNANASAYLFLYPYSETATADVAAGKVAFSVPAVQVAAKGTFDPKAAVAVASAAPADLLPGSVVKAKNVLSLLKIAVPADLDQKVIKVTVEAKGGETLAGDVVYDVAAKTNEVKAGGEASASVVLAAAPPMTEGVYYLAVRPCVVAKGIKVTVLLGDKTYYTRESSASFTFEPNHIYDLGTVGTSGWNVTSYQYVVSTVSGLGSGGLVDGAPSVAQWSHLGGIHYAPDGSLRIIDRGNAAIRKMTLDTYEVSTLCKGTPFNAPWHGAFASDGTFYIANKAAKTLVKVDANGQNPETIATGYADPIDVDFDASGNLFVLDRNANSIYSWTGTSASTQTKFTDMIGGLSMEFDPKGNLIVYSNKSKLHMVTPDGTSTVIAGCGTAGNVDGTPGQPLTAKLNNAFDLEVAADGTIFLAEDPNAVVKMIVPDANGSYEHAYVTTIIGTGKAGFADGIGTKAQLNSPYSICLSNDGKTMWIGDRANYRVRKVDVKAVTEKCGHSGSHENYGGTDGIVTIF